MKSATLLQDTSTTIEDLYQSMDKFNPWAELLNKYLEASVITQKNIAIQINVSPTTIHYWCNGGRLPNSDMVYLLISALQLSEKQTYMFIKTWLLTRQLRSLRPMFELGIQNNNLQYIETIVNEFSLGAYDMFA